MPPLRAQDTHRIPQKGVREESRPNVRSGSSSAVERPRLNVRVTHDSGHRADVAKVRDVPIADSCGAAKEPRSLDRFIVGSTERGRLGLVRQCRNRYGKGAVRRSSSAATKPHLAIVFSIKAAEPRHLNIQIRSAVICAARELISARPAQSAGLQNNSACDP